MKRSSKKPYTKSMEDEMLDLELAVETVENGLLGANAIKGQPPVHHNLQERMDFFRVPGFSIVLVDQGEIVWVKGYGLREGGSAQPVTEETVFQAASISKPVTAMVALHLVEAGLLDLDADVSQALKTWKIPENGYTREHKVTLRRLLSHMAGVNVSGYLGYPAGEPLPTLHQILNGEAPATSEPVQVALTPGENFSYSGGGYLVIEQLLEDVTGLTLNDLAQEIVFSRLGMDSSTFEHLPPERIAARAASAHRVDGNIVPGRWHTYPEHAAASLWSTPTDLARLLMEVLKATRGESKLVLSPEMTRQMLTPFFGWMGLGWVIVDKDGLTRIDHPGWNEGFHSYLAGFLESGQGLIWMTNGENGKLLGLEVTRGLAQACGWPWYLPIERIPVKVKAASLDWFAGRYHHMEYPDVEVEILNVGGKLVMQEFPGCPRYELIPESETSFFSLSRMEQVTFIEDVHGDVTTLMLGEYDQYARVG